ncbi:hypothetical protein [Sulfurimonas sp. NW9]|uniref:hypothetical protein n=1 Tax=Sulfurimonas sp. NW9 TaxID=2922728 RepID=UPI003DA81EAC
MSKNPNNKNIISKIVSVSQAIEGYTTTNTSVIKKLNSSEKSMASKYQLVSSEFYYDNSDVSRNKFNIKDTQTIHEIEKELLEEVYAIFFNERMKTLV